MPAEQSIAILRDLVALDTTSAKSNLALIDYLERRLAAHGVSSLRVPDETGAKANLWATIGPQGVPGIVLSGHTDTVPVEGQAWSSDPFTLHARDGRLYGRGACDMKGFLAVMLAMLPDMLAQPLSIPIHLAFSYDEEVGCLGAPRLIERLRADGISPRACIVGEPTSMQVVTAHKGKRSLRVEVTGRTCHSSLAPHGVNAVEYAARAIVHIAEIGRRLAQGPRDDLFDVPVSTAHTGTIRGGTVLNIVPEACTFEFEFRCLPGEDVDALVAEVVAYARDTLEPEMKAVAPEAGFTFIDRSHFPGLDTPPEAPATLLAKALARRNDHAKVAYGTEAGLFHEAGIPTVVCGPGSIEQAHKPDEFIDPAQLSACEAFMRRLIDHCAAG